MIRWILQTETSKACLLNTLKCGESWGVEGRKGKVFCFFVYTFPRFLCSWDFSFLLYQCPKQERMQCFWASGLLVQQQAYMYDTCNLNLQTNYLKENVGACFFFYTEYLLCAMFTESLKLCIWPFFNNTGDSHMVLKKKEFCFFPAFLTFTLNDTFLPRQPHSVPGPRQEQPAVHSPHFCKLLCVSTKGRIFHPNLMGGIRLPK